MASKDFHCHLLLMDALDGKKEFSEGTPPRHRLDPHFTIRGHRGASSLFALPPVALGLSQKNKNKIK